MEEIKEEAGATIEEAETICENALPLMTENGEDIWCKEKGIICYKALGDKCEDENPVTGIV